MAIFGVEIKDYDDRVQELVVETNVRLQDTNLMKNPFRGGIKGYPGSMYVLMLEPIYFNFTWFLWLAAGALYFFLGLTYWLIPPVLLGCLGIFWSKYFYYFMFKRGLKKKGYTGKTKLLSTAETLKRVVFHGTV